MAWNVSGSDLCIFLSGIKKKSNRGSEVAFELYERSGGTWYVRVLWSGTVIETSTNLGRLDMVPGDEFFQCKPSITASLCTTLTTIDNRHSVTDPKRGVASTSLLGESGMFYTVKSDWELIVEGATRKNEANLSARRFSVGCGHTAQEHSTPSIQKV